MATLRERQLAEIRKAAKNGQFKKSDVKEISKSALTKGLAELVNSGEIERVGVGVYSGSGAASSSSATPKKTVKQKAAKNKNDAVATKTAEKVKVNVKSGAVAAASISTYKVIVNGTTFGEFSMGESEIKDMVTKLQPNAVYSKTVKNEIHFSQRTADKN